jgi:hypothetical protein
MHRHRTLLVLLILLASNVLRAQTIFPKIGGWNLADSVKRFDTESLWEYIDGAADSYLNYGFRELELMEYAQSSDVYIKAEVYHQGSSLNAFGIYAFERPSEAEFLELGGEGYIVHSSLNFYIQDCYVKLHSHQTDEKTLAAIRKLASKLAVSITEQPEKPQLLELFPEYEIMPHSEKYFPTNFLGYSFLNNAIVADYLSNGQTYKLFLLIGDNTETALATLKKLLANAKVTGEVVDEKIYGLDDFFNGYMALMATGAYLLGILDMPDKETANDYLEQFADYVIQSGQSSDE